MLLVVTGRVGQTFPHLVMYVKSTPASACKYARGLLVHLESLKFALQTSASRSTKASIAGCGITVRSVLNGC